MAPTLTAGDSRSLRLISCLSDAEWAAAAELEERRLARERSMANHPAFRRRATSRNATVSPLPVRLHAVPSPSA